MADRDVDRYMSRWARIEELRAGRIGAWSGSEPLYAMSEHGLPHTNCGGSRLLHIHGARYGRRGRRQRGKKPVRLTS
ncbi:MAG: hypothetical protein MJE77_03390 [Proteobacteria bacterium]|nr:hypothetical protein [Pseudomonadota bacterium]